MNFLFVFEETYIVDGSYFGSSFASNVEMHLMVDLQYSDLLGSVFAGLNQFDLMALANAPKMRCFWGALKFSRYSSFVIPMDRR